MSKNIVWLPLARDDLEQIHNYYREVATPMVANQQLVKVVKAAKLLTRHPYLGHISASDNDRKVREWAIPKTHFVLPYLIEADDIVVLRVFDTRQEPLTTWKPS